MDRTKRLWCDMYLKHMPWEICWFCREWFCAQDYVKVGVGALHGGNNWKGGTKRK